jgi:hypothetical protein
VQHGYCTFGALVIGHGYQAVPAAGSQHRAFCSWNSLWDFTDTTPYKHSYPRRPPHRAPVCILPSHPGLNSVKHALLGSLLNWDFPVLVQEGHDCNLLSRTGPHTSPGNKGIAQRNAVATDATLSQELGPVESSTTAFFPKHAQMQAAESNEAALVTGSAVQLACPLQETTAIPIHTVGAALSGVVVVAAVCTALCCISESQWMMQVTKSAAKRACTLFVKCKLFVKCTRFVKCPLCVDACALLAEHILAQGRGGCLLTCKQ